MYLGMLFKTLKLIILIFNFSYFIGMCWLIICELIAEAADRENLGFNPEDIDPKELSKYHEYHKQQEYFIAQYDMHERSAYDRSLISIYFAFTSLSTVGFGDFTPKNNVERILTAIMLLFGVSIFSYIMGKILEMINVFKDFEQGFDDGDNLSKFFGVLEKFNNNKPFDIDLRRRIEKHFNYKWNNDKCMAIKESLDRAIFKQLPEYV